MRYKAIIKRVISPETYTQRTGIDLSHTDTSKLKCIEIEERPVIAPDRSTAFSHILEEIWTPRNKMSLTIIPV